MLTRPTLTHTRPMLWLLTIDTGQSLKRDPTSQEQDTDILSEYNHADMDNFENIEHESHTPLKALTRELDHLWHRVETAETQTKEAINHLECELHRLSLALWPSALPEPLDDVLQQYTETLCTAQKQTSFVSTLVQDIPTFNGSNSMQLEDWLVDIETTADLTDERRTKLAQAKSKGLTHTLIMKSLHGHSTKGQEIFSSLHA